MIVASVFQILDHQSGLGHTILPLFDFPLDFALDSNFESSFHIFQMDLKLIIKLNKFQFKPAHSLHEKTDFLVRSKY